MSSIVPRLSFLVKTTYKLLCRCPAMAYGRRELAQVITLLALIVHTHQIVKGRLARQCQFPYIAYVRGYSLRQRTTCGGTLIDDSHVVTAAHCVNDNHLEYFLLFGSTDARRMKIRIPVKEIIKHENFTRFPRPVNDMAILKLSRAVKLSKCIQPLTLAAPNDIFLPYCCIAGWGRKTLKSPVSRYLFHARVPLLTFGHCHRLSPRVTDHNVCAGQLVIGTQTTCEGDSGGPLVCTRKRDRRKVLVGVVSYGWNCREGLSVFSRVQFYKDWILRNSRTSLTTPYPEEAG